MWQGGVGGRGHGPGCIRRGGGGGLKGGGILSLNPLGTEGAKAKFWLSASNTGGGGAIAVPQA